ncbi:MAG TPA: FkbM family methyltransferase [Verrucomicrobiae bacterium]
MKSSLHSIKAREMNLSRIDQLPCPFLLNAVFRTLMLVTGRHGLFTLARWNARLFPRGELIRLPTSNLLYVPGDPHFIGYILGRHEHHITRLMIEKIRPGTLCLDAGANIGYFSAIMSALSGPHGGVLAFEPESDNFDALRMNAQLASRCGCNITATQAAVSDGNSTLCLVKGSASTLHQVTALSSPGQDDNTVECVRLDQIPEARNCRGAFLKVDVEGHEVQALEGCRELFEANVVSTAVVEVTPGPAAGAINEFMHPWKPETRCWLNGRWEARPLQDIPWRCDVWFDFGSGSERE